jgi:hypothetical protein
LRRAAYEDAAYVVTSCRLPQYEQTRRFRAYSPLPPSSFVSRATTFGSIPSAVDRQVSQYALGTVLRRKPAILAGIALTVHPDGPSGQGRTALVGIRIAPRLPDVVLDGRSTVMSESPTSGQMKNEGEGNRTADRKYRQGVREHVESGASEAAAEEAERALKSEEGAELRDAEEQGRAGKTSH